MSVAAAQNSTNVRNQNPLDAALRQAGWPLRALAAVSPTLAGRAAARAFFRTYRPPLRAEEAALLASAERFEVPFGRARLPAWSFGDGPTALLTHGWSGRAGQLAPLAAALATAGLRAVIFDHPAHGAARGVATTLPEMRHALEVVEAHVGGAHAIVAHSMGAILTTLAMARTIEPRRVAFIAPATTPATWAPVFARKLGLDAAVDAPMRRAIEARAGVSMDALDALAVAPRMEAPLLIVHDHDDREVPLAAGERLAGAWPGARLVRTRGLGHHRILRDPAVGEAVLGFLAELVRPMRHASRAQS